MPLGRQTNDTRHAIATHENKGSLIQQYKYQTVLKVTHRVACTEFIGMPGTTRSSVEVRVADASSDVLSSVPYIIAFRRHTRNAGSGWVSPLGKGVFLIITQFSEVPLLRCSGS